MSLQSAGGPASGMALDGVIQEIDIHTGPRDVGMAQPRTRRPGRVLLDTARRGGEPLRLLSHQLPGREQPGRHPALRAQHLGAVCDQPEQRRDRLAAGRQEEHVHARRGSAVRIPAQRGMAGQRRGQPVRRRGLAGGQTALARGGREARREGQDGDARRPARAQPGTAEHDQPGRPAGVARRGWMVGWGGLPNFTEFNAPGQQIYDAQLPAGENSYRVYREPWSAQPTEPPAIVRGVQRQGRRPSTRPGTARPPCTPGSCSRGRAPPT